MPKAFSVKDLPSTERPRERLINQGAEHVSAQELLAIVLGRGVAGHSIMTIAHELLQRFGSLEAVVAASVSELQKVPGLGPAKALQLKACLEIARRVSQSETTSEAQRQQTAAVRSPEQLASLVRAYLRDWHKEQFFVISLDTRHRVIGIDRIGMGTINASLVHPRETFDQAIARHATAIVIAHNHPSGDPAPSEADLITTKRLREAGEIMGIEVLDHIIVTQTTLASLRVLGHFAS